MNRTTTGIRTWFWIVLRWADMSILPLVFQCAPRSRRSKQRWVITALATLLWIGSSFLASSLLVAQGPPPTPGHWLRLEPSRAVSLRGVSVVDGNVVWASGAEGTVLRSIDGGRTITAINVPGTTPSADRAAGDPALDDIASDFRDVHAFDQDHACLMTAGQPARFYSTSDGGRTWSVAYECPDPRSFFNAMAFWNRQRGLAFSDPIDGRLLIVSTRDGGKSWQPLAATKQPITAKSEHGYAASGTCLTVAPRGRAWIGLGGAGPHNRMARVFRSTDYGQTWSDAASSLMGTESAGIFSLSFSGPNRGIAVGGDYKNPLATGDVLSLTRDGGRTWATPATHGLRGYRSCVARAIRDDREYLIAVGPTGCDWSVDDGRQWHPLGDDGFHAMAFAADGSAGFAVGADGRLARWTWHVQ